MKSLKFYFGVGFISLMTFSFSSSAHALDIKGYGAVNVYNTAATDLAGATVSTTAKPGFGFGAAGAIGIIPFILEVDVGVLYMKRIWTQSSVDLSYATLQIPVMARVSAIPIISPGVGAYFATAMGDMSVGSTTTTFASAGFNSLDIGLIGSVEAKFGILPMVKLVVDGRYLFGLTNSATTGDAKTREFQLLAGVSVGF
jgi:hypothetical protein